MKKFVIVFMMLVISLAFIMSNFTTISADEPPITFTTTGFEIGGGEFISSASQIVDPIEPADENVIAFDISKGQSTSSFESFIDDLQSMGYTVVTIDITLDGIPDNVEKLIISSAFYSGTYINAEAIMLEQWVDDGGELLVLAEWGPDFTENTDKICNQFGITQNSDQIIDTDDYDSVNIWVNYEGYNLDFTHPILYDVNSIVFYSGCSFDATDGVIIRTDDDGTATPSDAPAAIAKDWGIGRVAIFGDYDWISSYYGDYDNAKIAINTIIWLNGIITPPPGAESIRLIAGQEIYVGDVYVWNDNDNFHVLYRTFDDWYLLETHLQVSKTEPEIPQTKKGNPIPGHFEFSEIFDIKDYRTDWYISFPIPDNMEYGETIVIAAHAEVAHTSKGCMEIISDITTQSQGLTSGKPDGDSAYAWEHPAWSTPKSEFTLGADWIWESEYVFNPEIDNWVLFTKEFIIPGLYPIELLGDIKITCDNEYYTLSLNWVTIGTDDIWQTVETYDISDKLDVGSNEIQIIAKNLGVAGSTVTTNPGGLIYEAEVCYEVIDQEESAWGEGIQFSPHPKRNWGMYFEYTINIPPTAVINPENPSIPWCDPVYFDGTLSYDPDGAVVAYYWDFGDGTTSFQPMPIHQYPGVGLYTVTLTVTDNEGATGETTTTAEIYNTPPVADFSYDQPYFEWCEPIDFYDDSTDADACDTLTYLWDFGDGSTSTEQNPTYTYSMPGDYYVTLTVTDGYGASDDYTTMVIVFNMPPVADFAYDPNDPYWCEEVTFDGTYSYDPDWCDDIVLHEWDFDGDGTYDTTGEMAYHTFTSVGDNAVTLRVTDGAGATDAKTQMVTVSSEPPYADFDYSPYDPYWCEEVEFDASLSYDNDICDSIVLYEWDFENDGTYDASSTGVYVYYTFPSDGEYDVKLRVTDEAGQTSTKLRTVDVYNQDPTADFGVDDNYKYWCDQPFQFTDNSHDNDVCDSLSYDWDFGDMESSTEENPSHTYAWPGYYTVILTVTDEMGASNSYTDYVDVINEVPHVNPGVDETTKDWCEQPFDFHAGSYDPDGCGSLSYYWDFDDGQDSTLENPYHEYDDVGTYTVILTVTDDFGVFHSESITVYVENNDPYALFSWSPHDPYVYDSVLFTSSSSFDSDPCDEIVSWDWNFGDGATSTEENPSHTYTTAGTYTVSLEVTDGYGGTDYDEDYITVEVEP